MTHAPWQKCRACGEPLQRGRAVIVPLEFRVGGEVLKRKESPGARTIFALGKLWGTGEDTSLLKVEHDRDIMRDIHFWIVRTVAFRVCRGECEDAYEVREALTRTPLPGALDNGGELLRMATLIEEIKGLKIRQKSGGVRA